MNHRNILHTTCPFCHTAFTLDHDNIRQMDFKRRFKKYDYVTKSSIEHVLDAVDSIADDQDQGDDIDTTEL